MKGEIKKIQETPETPSGPSPSITPEMIQTAFKVLETSGMVHYSEGGVYVPTETGWKLLMEVGAQKEEINAYGNSGITATNSDSISITKGNNITDDRIGVNANKACKDLGGEFKTALMTARKVEIIIDVNGVVDKLVAFGSPALKLTDNEDIVIRKNDFIDGKTLAILSDKSIGELSNKLLEEVKKDDAKIKMILEISD